MNQINNWAVREKARLAKAVCGQMATLGTMVKNNALESIASALMSNTDAILKANDADVKSAEESNLSRPLINRLKLDERKIKSMSDGLKEVAALSDPIGNVSTMVKRPNGLLIGQMRVPLGVIGVIYEARPNVTTDAAGLCLKSGNCVILRGGSEAINSNNTLVKIISEAAYDAGIPQGAIQFIGEGGHAAVNELVKLSGLVDAIIPRGGAGLIKSVTQNATVPVIETGVGNCHIYVDDTADLDMALNIVVNAKISNPAVCNAVEHVLVHKEIAPQLISRLYTALRDNGVEVRGCDESRAICPAMEKASMEDWDTEYLGLVISIKIVRDMNESICHISRYGTGHSEAIVTQDYDNAWKFVRSVDAAAVYTNASTRFTDGNEFGLGAEIGISTQKLHARGPMGLNEMTTTKYIVFGNGQIRC